MEAQIKKLNQALHADDFNEDDFVSHIKRIVEKEGVLLRILDFKYFNEKRLEYGTQNDGMTVIDSGSITLILSPCESSSMR